MSEVPERAQLELELRPPVAREQTAPLVCPECHRPFPSASENAAVRSDARDTSRLAALRVKPRLDSLRWRVLQAIEGADQGKTDEELATELEMRLNTLRPRRWELVIGGWIQDSGRERKTSSGSFATVWTLSDIGRERLR